MKTANNAPKKGVIAYGVKLGIGICIGKFIFSCCTGVLSELLEKHNDKMEENFNADIDPEKNGENNEAADSGNAD